MNQENKSKFVHEMFSGIASKYDLLNLLLSFGRDRQWRRRSVQRLLEKGGDHFLDVATGTGDIAIEIVKQAESPVRVVGVDFVKNMLDIGEKKIKALGYSGIISMKQGDALSLPFESEIFDGAICAFGVRNFSDVKKGIGEMHRILREGGKLVILEFSLPKSSIFRGIYNFYFNYLLPYIGGLISGKKEAYTYLPDSVSHFASMENLENIMRDVGFSKIENVPLTFGIAAIYSGEK